MAEEQDPSGRTANPDPATNPGFAQAGTWQPNGAGTAASAPGGPSGIEFAQASGTWQPSDANLARSEQTGPVAPASVAAEPSGTAFAAQAGSAPIAGSRQSSPQAQASYASNSGTHQPTGGHVAQNDLRGAPGMVTGPDGMTRLAPPPPPFDRRAAEAWFRRRGLPLFVRSDEQGSRLLQRAVPALVFVLVMDPVLTLVTWLLNVPEAEFERRMANTAYVFVLLVLIVAAVVVPVLCGWLASLWMRALSRSGRWVLARVVLILNVVVLPLVDWWTGLRDRLWLSLTINVGVTLLMLFFVLVGAGSILAWSLRKAVSELGTVGRMATKALPLLVLVVIFAFFSAEMWQVADALPRWRLWLVVALFAVLGVLFMAARLDEELKKMIDTVANDKVDDLAAVLRSTPLAGAVASGPIDALPLGRRERANITLVLFVAQLLQVVLLTVLVFCVLIALGALAIDGPVIDSWLGEDKSKNAGSLFQIALPLPSALVQVSLFLATFSGLYFAASVATDQHYREAFYEPLLADVRVSLAARQVYLARRDDAS